MRSYQRGKTQESALEGAIRVFATMLAQHRQRCIWVCVQCIQAMHHSRAWGWRGGPGRDRAGWRILAWRGAVCGGHRGEHAAQQDDGCALHDCRNEELVRWCSCTPVETRNSIAELKMLTSDVAPHRYRVWWAMRHYKPAPCCSRLRDTQKPFSDLSASVMARSFAGHVTVGQILDLTC